MNESTTHLAGPLVGFIKEDRIIQRCMLCGEKLMDYKPSCVMIPQGVFPDGPPRFAEGYLIRITPGNPQRVTDLGQLNSPPELPDDFCLALVEENS